MTTPRLTRQLGILGLTATGVCSMLGASINVVPFMIQRHVPGIGAYVLPAFLFAAIPAILAAIAYSMLASAMPRAGGSYLYASRGLNPYLGFVASFSQWFGLSIVIGVVAYVTVPFFRDIAVALEFSSLSAWLEGGIVRVTIALLLVWIFVLVNIRGLRLYEKTVVPLMIIMFLLGGIVIVAGFSFTQEEFLAKLAQNSGQVFLIGADSAFDVRTFLSAAALLFASFIGFDSIAQAGGEAKFPTTRLPLAIGLTIVIVGGYYMLFTGAVYHAVPWSFIAAQAQQRDITAPGMLSYLLPPGLTVAIVAGAAIALINDLPAMLLSVSRLMFAWAEDGIFPVGIKRIHTTYQSPYVAILLSGVMASIGILGSHFAGDFFLGIDIMVISMMVNFLLMCITIVSIDHVNPALALEIGIIKSVFLRRFLGGAGILVLLIFIGIHVWKDITTPQESWYFHSTLIWCLVMAIGSLIFYVKFGQLKKQGIDTRQLFQKLP